MAKRPDQGYPLRPSSQGIKRGNRGDPGRVAAWFTMLFPHCRWPLL